MIGPRLEIRATLKVLSPLHIGTGKSRKIERDGNETSSVREIDLDGHGNPFLPGSSLKGVLRDILRDDPDLALAFGPATIREAGDAAAGLILFRNAWFAAPPPRDIRDTVADRSLAGPHAATFVEVHVSKDADAGVAAKALLFHDDMVLPGTTFTLSLALMHEGDDLRRLTGLLLGHLARDEGVAFGRSGRQGLGRVRLLPESLTCTRQPGGKTDRIALLRPQVPAPDFRLRLVSPVPFLIHDPARKPPPAQGAEAQRNNVQLALRAFDGKGARLTGSTLIGALKAAFADFAHRHSPAVAADATLRLFGTADRRGRVNIDRLSAISFGSRKEITSVRIDRFSGAPVDNALFATEGFVGAAFDVDLRLEARPSLSPQDQADDDRLFAAFVTELKDGVWGGLMLGHGSSRGFGWFTVEERAT